MRVLLLDGGNTSVKWRLETLDGEGAYVSSGCGSELHSASSWHFLKNSLVDKILFADVSGLVAGRLKSEVPELSIQEIHSAHSLMGVKNCYESPERMGVDRFLSAVEAYQQSQKACCVIDLGTAAKVDVVDGCGQHQGGYIVPGFHMAQEALLANTGKVRFREGEIGQDSNIAYGRSTIDAVQNGCRFQLIAWVMALLDDFQSSFPDGDVYLAGGDKNLVLGALTEELNGKSNMLSGGRLIVAEDLVLQALSRLLCEGAD